MPASGREDNMLLKCLPSKGRGVRPGFFSLSVDSAGNSMSFELTFKVREMTGMGSLTLSSP